MSFVTIDMQIQYRGAVVEEDQVAEGWVTSRGRSIIFCEAEVVTASGKQVDKGMLTYRLLGPRRS
jgi:acyl-coenzyme A thioesterase PaaI-like protein